MTESELALSDSKVNELNRALLLMKDTEQESTKLHKAEMTRAHEVIMLFVYLFKSINNTVGNQSYEDKSLR